MTLKDYVPSGFKDHLRVLAARRHFPGRRVESAFVSCDAMLGTPCAIERDAIVAAGARLGDHTAAYRGAVIGSAVQLGDYSYVNEGSLVISGHIGRFCSISPACTIGLQEHPLTLLSTSPLLYGDDNVLGEPRRWEEITAPPQIGSDVWIGAHAVILQGVSIGHGAVIAAGAVVTRDVPPYAVVGGVPAKVIKMRFSEETVRALLELSWWDWPLETLQRHAALFALNEAELLSQLKAVLNNPG